MLQDLDESVEVLNFIQALYNLEGSDIAGLHSLSRGSCEKPH
jgi:hypothetical protein